MIEEVKKLVAELLGDDKSGHGFDHIMRVYNLSIKFAEAEKSADKDIVGLSALLHDVDDYKLFGDTFADNLTNAKRILKQVDANVDTSNTVLKIINTMGYSKLLKGIRPDSIEGQIVSDADMCDAMGATGILRNFAYTLKHNRIFFDNNIWPVENISAEVYKNKTQDTSVCHFFEKLLKLQSLMLTKEGKKEAIYRNEIMVDFLRHFFKEVNATDWGNYLEDYLKKHN